MGFSGTSMGNAMFNAMKAMSFIWEMQFLMSWEAAILKDGLSM